MNRQRKDYRRQLEHDRAVHAAVLRGDKPPEWSKHDERDEDDEMGDSFSITGDTNNHYYPTETPQVQPATQEASGMSNWTKAAVVAASLLGGSGIGAAVPWLAGAYEPTVVEQPSQDFSVGLEVVPDGAVDE